MSETTTDTVREAADTLLVGVDSPKGRMLRIEIFMCLIVAIFLALAVFGSLRRIFGNNIIRLLVWAAYTSSYSTLFYTVGLMSSAPFRNDLFAVWAIVLLYILDSADSITAYSLDDNETVLRHIWEAFYAVVFVGIVVGYHARGSEVKTAIWVIFVACMARPCIRFSALYLASKSSRLLLSTKIVSDFMSYEHTLSEEEEPSIMGGYKYIVRGDDESLAMLHEPDCIYKLNPDRHGGKVITVDKVWRCEGPLLSSEHANGPRLKDACLSFALYKMLRRRLTDFPLHELETEQARNKTWSFVCDGLLSRPDDLVRAFRVVEMELAFLFDFCYTKYAAMMEKGFPYWKTITELIILVCSIWIAVKLQSGNVGNTEIGAINSIGILVTRVVLGGWAGTLLLQFYALLTSEWTKVWLLCEYVERSLSGKRKKPLELAVRIIHRLKYMPPWSNQIGQHNLLHSPLGFRRVFRKYIIGPKASQLQLPEVVKIAVLETLKAHGRRVNKGRWSLRRNEVLDKLEWACSLDSIAHCILVWHIATALCESEVIEASNTNDTMSSAAKDGDRDLIVAKFLSNYCAYLVAFYPKLIPGNHFSARIVYDSVVWDLDKLVNGKQSKQSTRNQIKSEELKKLEGRSSIVKMAATLFRELGAEVGGDDQQGKKKKVWKVLAEFWTEMVLYVAPCDDADTHIEHLKKGGEFVTQLWGLLTHAGIVGREDFVREAA